MKLEITYNQLKSLERLLAISRNVDESVKADIKVYKDGSKISWDSASPARIFILEIPNK